MKILHLFGLMFCGVAITIALILYITNTYGAESLLITTGDARIAFTSNRDGNDEIYVMNQDGSNLTRLTNNIHSDYGPAWSPDGTQIAFVSNRDSLAGNVTEIYIMNQDGTNVNRFTWNNVRVGRPSWSPDGQYIVYSLARKSDGWRDIIVQALDHSSIKLIAGGINTDNHFATWGSNGIYFESNRAGTYDLWFIRPDGSGLINLTAVADNGRVSMEATPSQNPIDGRILFHTDRDQSSNFELWVIDKDGRNETRITDNYIYQDAEAAWSPNGKKIVYYSTMGSTKSEIYIANGDGTGLQRLTDNTFDDYMPAWSPGVVR